MTKFNVVKAENLAYIAQAGNQLIELDETQRAAWIELLSPVWTELGVNLVGDEVMARLKKILGIDS